MSTGRSITLEYCGACGWAPKAKVIEKKIMAAFPNVSVVHKTGPEGRSSSFEVFTDKGEVLWSKLAGQGFPQPNDVVELMRKAGYQGAEQAPA